MGRVRSRTKTRWTAEERQLAMEQRLRAQTIPALKRGGPAEDEWDYEDDEYPYGQSVA
jgi:nicotinamide mononucleotide adenylyltransferase